MKSAFSAGFSSGFGNHFRRGYLKILTKDHPTYEEGDILAAVPWIGMRRTYTEGAIFTRGQHRKFGRINEIGFFNKDDVAEDYFKAVNDRKLVRTGKHTCKLVRLIDGVEVEEIEYTTGQKDVVDWDGKPVAMDVDRYFGDRAKTLQKNNAQGRPLFGNSILSCEIYGGKTNFDDIACDKCWDALANKHGQFEETVAAVATPWNLQEHRKHLIICTNNFTDEECGELVAPLIEDPEAETPVTLKKRKSLIEWRGLRDVVEAEVLNKNIPVQIENIRKHIRQTVVQNKSV